MTDEALVMHYKKGDNAALEILIQRYLPLIYGFSRRYSGDPERAADITQETFIKMWKNIRSFDTARSFKPWVFTIAKHTALDWLKRKEATPFSFFRNEEGEENIPQATRDHESLEDLLDTKDAASDARRALSRIPVSHAKVVLMHHDEELTFKEIARVLQEPLNTVKSRYWRAIQFLRKSLSDQRNNPF